MTKSKPPVDLVSVPRAVLAAYLASGAKHWQDKPKEYAILAAAVKK